MASYYAGQTQENNAYLSIEKGTCCYLKFSQNEHFGHKVFETQGAE